MNTKTTILPRDGGCTHAESYLISSVSQSVSLLELQQIMLEKYKL